MRPQAGRNPPTPGDVAARGQPDPLLLLPPGLALAPGVESRGGRWRRGAGEGTRRGGS